MSKYTTEVRYICETAAGYDESKGFDDVDQIIEDSIDSIFSFDFPVFDENYRNVICTKILRHYYTREIGFETVGLWKLKLQTRLNEIMPFYNQLYESQLIKFNPLYDVDLTTTHAGNKTGESNREENKTAVSNQNASSTENGSLVNSTDTTEADNKIGSARTDGTSTEIGTQNTRRQDSTNKVGSANYNDSESGTNYDLYSDTPQGALTDVDDEEYLTNARKITDSKSKSGKRDDSEIATADTTENGDSTAVGQTNTSNKYDEQNNKITSGKTSTTDDRSSTDTTTRNDLENLTGSDKFTNTESYVLHVIGKQAGISFSKMLTEFRETFLNIDMEVINSLSDLFFNLW